MYRPLIRIVFGYLGLLSVIALGAAAVEGQGPPESPDNIWKQLESPALCVRTDADRARISKLLLDATDDALQERMKQLFEIWLRDDRDQPRRAVTGLVHALAAYKRVQVNIRKWNPQVC